MPGQRNKHRQKGKPILLRDEASDTSTNKSIGIASRERVALDTSTDEPSAFDAGTSKNESSVNNVCDSATGQDPSGIWRSCPDTEQHSYRVNSRRQIPPKKVTTPKKANPPKARKSLLKQQGVSVHETDKKKSNVRIVPTPPSRGTGSQVSRDRSRSRRRSPLNFANLDVENSLFDAITNNPASPTDIVDQWIELYKKNRDNAASMLLQFFVDSCGAKFTITSVMQATMEYDAIVRLMTEEDTNDRADYPLIAVGQWKKFHNIYSEFVAALVHRCRNSIIYDTFIMDKVVSLLTELSYSQVRAYRHTATLAAMKLMSALVGVAATVSTDLSNIERQYQSERQKSRVNRSTDRLKILVSKLGELEENMEEIKNILGYMFQSVFVRRYIDVAINIRALCIVEFGLCVLKFHDYFLKDEFLRYIGWSLYDEAGEVRLKCLEVLEPLYASEILTPKLDLFTRKFKDRIVAMICDKEFDVAGQAIKIIATMMKHHRDIVTDDDCEKIYRKVYSVHRGVAHAAGEFVNDRLFTADDDTVIGVKTSRGKQRLPNTPVIRDLVTFFVESELPEHAAFLVDSLIETNAMMNDWECMTDLLLEEAGPDEESLDNQQETCLIEIMVHCIKQAATGEAPIGRETSRNIVSVKKKKKVENDKEKLTEHFTRTLNPLLKKYQPDSEKIVHLLAVPQYFNLELYTTSRQTETLDDLLKMIGCIVDKIHDTDVLETAAKTLECMCLENLGIFERCDIARSVILDNIVDEYREANDRYTTLIDESQIPDEDEIFQLVHSLRKVSVFYSFHDMNSYEIWDPLWKSLEDVRFSKRLLPDEAIAHCTRACYFSIIRSQLRLIESTESRIQVMNDTRRLTERLHSFIDLMMHFVGSDGNVSAIPSAPVVRDEAYKSICDLLVFFNHTMSNYDNRILHQLEYIPDENMQTMLNRFVQENVFCEEPDEDRDDDWKIEQLHKRRNFLTGFCKLPLYVTFPAMAAANVFKHYVKYFDDYGDILKHTIGKYRDRDTTTCARTLLGSLKILYDEMIEARGEAIDDSQEFTAIKTLATKFALFFNAFRDSKALVSLHGDGILFAIKLWNEVEKDTSSPPKNLLFLEVLVPFSNKLVEADKAEVLRFVEKNIPHGVFQSEERLAMALHLYKNSLSGDEISVGSKSFARRNKKHGAGEPKRADSANEKSTREPRA